MVWPRELPDIGSSLTERQQFTLLHRILATEGWQENLSGHITWDRGGGTFWCTPWGRWWEEVRASDVMTVDADGRVLDGPWDVTPAVHLHTELHRARPDATLIVHGHPFAATALACMDESPVISHQNSCIFDGGLLTIDEYAGTIEDPESGAGLAHRTGVAVGIQLAHHGAIVLAPTIEEIAYLGATYERMARFTLAALQAGTRLRALPLGPEARDALRRELRTNAPAAYWNGAVRGALRADPDID